MRPSAPASARHDKVSLGSGDGLAWTPRFPAWHDTPGFWDEAHFLQYALQPLFALSFVGPDGNADLLRARRLRWTPTALQLDYAWSGVAAVETRSAPGDRRLVSEWSITNRTRRTIELDVVLWAVVAGESVGPRGVTAADGGLRLVREVTDWAEESREFALDHRLDGATGREAVRSELSGATPRFDLTPLYDTWPGRRRLSGSLRLEGIDRTGAVYIALHRRLRIAARRTASFSASVRVTPLGVGVPRAPSPRGSAAQVAAEGWERWLSGGPSLRSGDRHFGSFWDHRWWGLRLHSAPAGTGQYRTSTVCEGPGFFHQPISYSAMCHARELRWRHAAAESQGVIDTFFDHQAPDGKVPGRVYLDHLTRTDFYHADWGGAVEDVLDIHPDPRWSRTLYPRLARYATWLTDTRDAEGSGMIDVVDQFETGQEYMSRYQAVDPGADRYGWEERIRLKGIDVTVYAYRLYVLLARLAPEARAAGIWRALADRTRAAVRGAMWDPAAQMFSDVDPRTGRRTGVKAAVCFYPYLTDLVDDTHIDGMGRHLFDRREFWTPWPVPSSSVDDPLFDPDARWKGKRHACPWNGRVWPMTNSHVTDALARVARLHRPEWAPKLVELLGKFVRMMSFDQDPRRPNSFEHYHPFNGRGSVYRGVDDYQHSWVNDLIVRHVAGVLPMGEEGVVFDPMPFGVPVRLSGVRVAGHRIDVEVSSGRYRARVDGRLAAAGRIGAPSEVRW